MLSCQDKITPEQIEILQTYKDEPTTFDHTQADYMPLLAFSFDDYKVDENLPEDKKSGPIEMSQQEVYMQTVVEVSHFNLYLDFNDSGWRLSRVSAALS